ncbi:unnamed protein product [Sphagnum balticum]
MNGGTCIDYLDSYQCTCASGFTDVNCDLSVAIWLILQEYQRAAQFAGVFETSMDFIRTFDYTVGNCFTSTGTHPSIWAICTPDAVPDRGRAGFRVYIHLPNQNVYSESVGFSVAPGISFDDRTAICLLQINFENKYVLRRNTSTWARHTMIASRAMESPAIVCCRKACTDTLMADPAVGCYDPRYPRPYYDPTLTPVTNMLSTQDERIGFPSCANVSAFNSDPIRGNPATWTKCNCPIPCTSGAFDVHLSRGRFQENNAQCVALSTANQCVKTRNTDTVRLEVYLEDLNYFVYVETAQMDVSRKLGTGPFTYTSAQIWALIETSAPSSAWRRHVSLLNCRNRVHIRTDIDCSHNGTWILILKS